MEWKKQREERRQKEIERKAAEEAKKGAKGQNVFTGKALFKFDPTLFQDDEGAVDADTYEEREEEEEKKQDEPLPKNDEDEHNKQDGVDGDNVDTNLF